MDVNDDNPDSGGFWGPHEPLVYFAGLDLGQRADYTALSVLERHGVGREAYYHLRHLHRYPLNTSYPSIVNSVRELCLREPLLSTKARLAIDSTGAGIPVVELFTLARPQLNAAITPISIHGGNEVVRAHGGFNCPKRELVSVVQAFLQTDRLKVAAELPLANVLIQELQTFEVSISESGFDSYNARTGQHDDLVLSLALALWLGQNEPVWKFSPLRF
jgi:hypothetical protein